MAKKITVTQKRWLVSAHILCNIVWLGTTLCFLVLSIAAASTNDVRAIHPIYMMVDVLDRTLIWTSSIGTLVRYPRLKARGFLADDRCDL